MDAISSKLSSEEFSFLLLDLREKIEQLFLYDLTDYKFVFRPLYISEIESISALSDIVPDYIIDDWIISKTLLLTTHSKDYLLNDAPAGVAASLARSVLQRSSPGGINQVYNNLAVERAKFASDYGLIESNIIVGTGNILGKDYKKITAREQSKYLALAEFSTGRKLEIQPTSTDKKGRKKQISKEAAAILSKEAADKPDFEADNKMFRAL